MWNIEDIFELTGNSKGLTWSLVVFMRVLLKFMQPRLFHFIFILTCQLAVEALEEEQKQISASGPFQLSPEDVQRKVCI